MTPKPPADDSAVRHARLNQETGRIPFRELQRFFAAGRVLHVDVTLDLVAVGDALQCDRIEEVGAWKAARRLGPVTDETARGWIDKDVTVWALTVAPFVLVQQKD